MCCLQAESAMTQTAHLEKWVPCDVPCTNFEAEGLASITTGLEHLKTHTAGAHAYGPTSLSAMLMLGCQQAITHRCCC